VVCSLVATTGVRLRAEEWETSAALWSSRARAVEPPVVQYYWNGMMHVNIVKHENQLHLAAESIVRPYACHANCPNVNTDVSVCMTKRHTTISNNEDQNESEIHRIDH